MITSRFLRKSVKRGSRGGGEIYDTLHFGLCFFYHGLNSTKFISRAVKCDQYSPYARAKAGNCFWDEFICARWKASGRVHLCRRTGGGILELNAAPQRIS